MTSDSELLHRYVECRSNADFTELVSRHIDVVYRSALRRTNGRADLAQDISQEVFTLLARKAVRLVNHDVLVGWLYTATRNTANSVMRAERRRRQRELEAQESNTLDTPPNDLTRLQGELDRVLDQLSAADREALLLRFFKDRGFGDVGEALGLSEEAARKRVNRALERLRERLGRQGITSSATALAAFLSTEAAFAAPVGLAGAIGNAAMASGTGTTLSLLVATKFMSIKSIVGLGCIVGLVGLGVFIAVVSNRPRDDRSTEEKSGSLPQAQPSSGSEASNPAVAVAPDRSPAEALPAGPPSQIRGAPQADGESVVLLPDGTFADDQYHVMGKIPVGWTIVKSERWGQKETSIHLRDPAHPAALAIIYYQLFSEAMPRIDQQSADIWLRRQATYKAKQRIRDGSPDYANGEVISRTISNQPAVTWTAGYTREREPWAEYLTRIYSPDCTLLFTIRAPEKDLAPMVSQFETTVNTTTVPRLK